MPKALGFLFPFFLGGNVYVAIHASVGMHRMS